jgi:RING finger and CHY zinc finger domain-containing protein 1
MMECPDYDKCGELAFYSCRLCHDADKFDAELDPKKNHQLKRHEVKKVKCLRCGNIQPKSKTCEKCKEDFAKYFCSVCCLYDDDGDKKGVFHCDGCGICRVGGKENFFHCDNCVACLSIFMKDNHKCKPAIFK